MICIVDIFHSFYYISISQLYIYLIRHYFEIYVVSHIFLLILPILLFSILDQLLSFPYRLSFISIHLGVPLKPLPFFYFFLLLIRLRSPKNEFFHLILYFLILLFLDNISLTRYHFLMSQSII